MADIPSQVSEPTWVRVTNDVGPGWVVTQFDASTGEARGTVEAAPHLEAGVFRVPVLWNVGARQGREVVEAPLNQRAVRYFDSTVLISGVRGVWLLRPGS